MFDSRVGCEKHQKFNKLFVCQMSSYFMKIEWRIALLCCIITHIHEVAFSLKLCFVLGWKQGMFIKYYCSSWYYSRVGDFCWQFGIGERKFCMLMDQPLMSVTPTLLQSARSMALNAMAVECEWFIYSLLHSNFYIIWKTIAVLWCECNGQITVSFSIVHCLVWSLSKVRKQFLKSQSFIICWALSKLIIA